MHLFSEKELSLDSFLDGKLHIWQPLKGYRAATDPVFLAAACPAKEGEEVLELGCGAGTASFCLFRRLNVKLTGVELQLQYAKLGIKNGLHNKIPIEVETSDLRNLSSNIREKLFHQVMMNPPYYGAGTPGHNNGKESSQRINTPLTDWVNIALKRLKPKGWITIINTPENLTELLNALGTKVGDISIKPLASREHMIANRVIIRAKKSSRGITKIFSPLIVHTGKKHLEDSDSYSMEASGVLRNANPIHF